MPSIPEIEAAPRSTDIGSEEHALAVARILAGVSKREDGNRFLTVIRRYFREDKEAKKEFLSWYEDIPAEETEKPKKKKSKKLKAKKKREESDEDEKDNDEDEGSEE